MDEQCPSEESEQVDTDDTIDRRTFIGAAALTPFATNLDQFQSRTMTSGADKVYVSNETELRDALGTYPEIEFTNNITLTKTLQADLGDGDVSIKFATYTLAKADGVNDEMVDITTTGDVELRGGTVDCNRDGQNFPTVKSKELNFSNGGEFRVRDVTLLDNSDYGFVPTNFDTARFGAVTIDSNPELLTNSSDAAGLDGIHTFDCPRVRVDDSNITAGGDGIAIAANNKSVDSVSISGGTISSPVYGNGIRLHVQSGAAADTTISGIEIDTSISDCDGQGVEIINESTNGNSIDDIAITGSITGVNGNGVRTYDPVENVVIMADISNVGANGVNVAAGGRAIGIHSSIDAADVNGIHAEDATEVIVTNASITNCGNWPIISKGSSNRWNVVENVWSGNRFGTITLANDDNNVAFNN